MTSFCYRDLSLALSMHQTCVGKMVRKWAEEGLIELSHVGDRKRRYYRVIQGKKPANTGTVTGNLWRAMRMLKSFTPLDLAAHARTPEVGVEERSALDYCEVLSRTGYLKLERKADARLHRAAVYRLIRNTGPIPPQPRRVTAVYDGNLAEYALGKEGVE
ncbi:hypothetical protein OEZ60_20545 [Defluviimonas sp. WL0024]|uniref:Uncharacterized protein n=1 Tax=Albidovulum salinarum TaxID=2984153 RepID=A0ABT2X8V3_9RHOB|nr:hypothetical protein [Defluviimonas sp. WL0024]MCU9850378.1 hypothetical protein [Defluviimonas sp. WL0024]